MTINKQTAHSLYLRLLRASVLVVLFLGSFTAVDAATMSVSPATGVYTAGNTFSASIIVNTAGEPINAAEGTLSFNPAEVTVVSIARGSMFNLWTVEPEYSNSAGTIRFGGGSPRGYTGAAGTVMTITFRAKTAGSARVQFSNGSVLAADGQGTNVLTNMSNGNFTIVAAEVEPEPEVIEYVAPANTPAAPVIRSTTHPDPTKWSQTTTAELTWNLPPGVTGVRTLLNESSGSIPTKVYEPPIDSISLTDLKEGVQYFHLQFRNAEGWGRVTHYRLAIDTTDPESFSIELPETADLSNPEQTLRLNVSDATSPVTDFMVQIDGDDPFEHRIESGASSTITLPPLEPGRHTVIIEAFDAAGNSIADTFSFTITAFDRPVFTDYPTELNEGVIPVMKGQTRPRSEVTITVTRAGVEPRTYSVVSDGAGEFIFIPDQALERGVYQISAVAIDEHGAQSDPSDTITVAVQQPGYIQIGSLIISVLSVVIPLIALILLLVAFVWYVIYRLRRLRTRVGRESAEAASILDEEIEGVLSLLETEETALINSRRSNKLTKAEEHLITSMKEALRDTKRRVSAEIEDVEELVSNTKKNS